MKSYSVLGLVDASMHVTVQAENPEAAIDAAADVLSPSLCHQCSAKMNADNVYDFIVVDDETGEEVITSQSSQADARIKALESVITTLAAWASTDRGGMGGGLHSTVFPPISPSAQRLMRQLVEQAKGTP